MRLADIDNIQSLIACDIYYHKKCKFAYLSQYQESISKCVFCDQKVSSKMKIGIDTVKFLLKRARDDFDIAQCCKLLNYFDEADNQFVSPLLFA